MSKEKADRSKEPIDWDLEDKKAVAGTRPDAKYGAVSESLRHTIPQATACSLFCGGRKCKYCTASHWREDQMLIKGLFSHWVTDNILAMARPTNEGNEKYDFIEQFTHHGIKSIINLQTPGEHGSCGPPLDPSGFSYNPQEYMDNDIFFYNFAWPDYNVGSLANVLDMVKVMQFALSEGKVAVHCHAGLGRTGVLIAAYLVFANRMNPHEAVHYLRSKRTNQSYEFTLGQYLIRQKHLLHGFESRELKNIPKLLYVACERLLELAEKSHCKLPLMKNTFKPLTETDRPIPPTIQETEHHPPPTSRSSTTLNNSNPYLGQNSPLQNNNHQPPRAQSMTDLHLNGPKQGDRSPVLSRRAVVGAGSGQDVDSIGRPSSQFFLGSDPDLRYRPLAQPGAAETLADQIAVTMGQTEYPPDRHEQVESIKSLLNEDASTWLTLQDESDGLVLSKLMWDWLDHLKEPVLSVQDMPDVLNHADEPLVGLSKLERGPRGTVEYLFGVVARLQPLQEKIEFELIQRILSVLSHQNITVDSDLPLGASGMSMLRRTTNLGEMTSSLAMRLVQFAYNLLYVLRTRLQEEQERERQEKQEADKKRASKRGSKKKNKRASLET